MFFRTVSRVVWAKRVGSRLSSSSLGDHLRKKIAGDIGGPNVGFGAVMVDLGGCSDVTVPFAEKAESENVELRY